MHRNPRPENVCQIGVAAEINTSNLSAVFRDRLSNCALSYFLPLPQLFQAKGIPTKSRAGASVPSTVVSTAADVLDADIFLLQVPSRPYHS